MRESGIDETRETVIDFRRKEMPSQPLRTRREEKVEDHTPVGVVIDRSAIFLFFCLFVWFCFRAAAVFVGQSGCGGEQNVEYDPMGPGR